MSLVKIFTVDFYMSPPIQGLDSMYSDFRGSSINQVPIIRIFGSSETGCKTCLHIHGVFPYIYIPFEGSENPTSVMYQVAIKLDQGINIALGQSSSNAQHVYKIVRVSGIPLYGYHSIEHQFLKIYFYNPLFMKKACNLLQNGSVLGNLYQLHEAHIPFILQFMIDYNLHGMNYISLSEVWYRRNPENPQPDIPEEHLLPLHINKISTCEVEVDGLAEYIVNRLEVIGGQVGKNPGIAALWDDEMQRRRNKDECSQISPCLSQSRVDIPPTDSHTLFKENLKQRLLSKIREEHKLDKNMSVYPAETPREKNILSASCIESHSPVTCKNPSYTMLSNNISDEFDDSISMLDKTFINNNLNDTDAKDLLEVLIDLGDNMVAEEGSILSQAPKDREDSDEDNEVDMSLPLAAVTTPVKIIEDANIENYENIKADTTSQKIKFQIINDDEADKLNKEQCDNSEGSSGDLMKNSLDTNLEKDINTLINIRTPCEDHVMSNGYNADNSNHQTTIDNTAEKAKRKLSFIDIEIPLLNNHNEHCSETNDNENNKIESTSRTINKKLSTQKSSQSSDELFHDEINHIQNETFITENPYGYNSTLLLAEKYDIVNNYVSEQGPSKLNVETAKFSKSLSGNSKNSDSDSFTSYQKCSGKVIDSKLSGQSSNDSTSKILNKMKLTQNLGILESPGDPSVVSKYNVLMPKFNPPSKEIILTSLKEYNIPEIRHKRPFYSDFLDATGEVHVGNKVLKIESTSDLIEFENQAVNQGLQQLRKLELQKVYSSTEITNNRMKSMKLSFCENISCFVTTAKQPPTFAQVEKWLKVKKSKTEENVVQKKEKLKILVPCSPGGQSDSDNDDCISLSPPFSPIDNAYKSTNSEESIQETPRSSLKTKKQVIVKKSKKQKIKTKITTAVELELPKSKNNKNTSLCKTLLQSQFLNNFPSPSETVNDSGQITIATPDNTHGFKMSLENLQKVKVVSKHECLAILVMELHIHTRAEFKPDPQLDPIKAIFYSLHNDMPEETGERTDVSGLIASNISDHVSLFEGSGITCELTCVDSEINLIEKFLKFIKKWDPDIFAGYEVEMLSWGYLVERGYALGMNLQSLLGRTQIKLNIMDDDIHSGLKFTGRILLDVWRLMRHEVALQSYTFENIMYHVLHLRIPLYSFKDLSLWWEHKSSVYRHRTVNFYLCKVRGIIKLFNQLDLIGRTCELARLFGIQFYEVLSRGSQFRVESMMLRLAKPLNYVAVSPTVQQRAKMKAPEYIPLILEPESKFYSDPVIVLDFQSLYPSIIIAYNYCFSTCLGRVEYLGQNNPFVFGATQLKISNRRIKQLFGRNLINFTPCGVGFVKTKVRQGILPRMLLEILDTRLMVKKSMKQNKHDKVLQRVLQNRQLGLKLIANVTYGYTAANFSGRMPAVEVGDSVVSKGRETLLRAIKLIENTPHWGARVVYGDTDSVFVLVPGKSREYAFKIGAEIADAVTKDNPSPVTLKLEKVYHPCILQTKKRYVGYKYESPEQTKPEFDAKGIETVRRDGCPAVSKMLEKSLKILFDTSDVSLVRKYVLRQFTKLLSGRISLQDLTFAKEYRGASNYRPGACVPVLELTRKWLTVDKRSEPRHGERVPYIIIHGPPGLPLIKLVRSPRELLSDSSLLPNMTYYITRAIIPPLNRCFTLIGADLNIWFNNMPRKQKYFLHNVTPDSMNKKGAISHYFATTNCVACNQKSQQGLCTECCNSPQETVAILQNKIRLWERSFHEINRICDSCAGHSTNMQCISLDCPVLYYLTKANKDLQQTTYVKQVTLTALNLEL